MILFIWRNTVVSALQTPAPVLRILITCFVNILVVFSLVKYNILDSHPLKGNVS